MAASAAALPVAAAAAKPAADATAKLAGDVVARTFDALAKPLVHWEVVKERLPTKRKGPEVRTASITLPAWFVAGAPVAGAFAMWLVGLGLSPGPDGLVFSQRPRLVLPFAGMTNPFDIPGSLSASKILWTELTTFLFGPILGPLIGANTGPTGAGPSTPPSQHNRPPH